MLLVLLVVVLAAEEELGKDVGFTIVTLSLFEVELGGSVISNACAIGRFWHSCTGYDFVTLRLAFCRLCCCMLEGQGNRLLAMLGAGEECWLI